MRSLLNLTGYKLSLIPRAAALIGVCAAATGCVHAPAFPQTDVALAAAWRGEVARTVAPPVDHTRWWAVFDDPDLDGLVGAALAQNLSIEQAIARLDAARALVTPARSQGLPQVSGSGSARFERQLQGPDTPESSGFGVRFERPDRTAGVYQGGLDASWEPDLFARARNATRSARATAGIAEADLRAIRVSVTAEVAQAYLETRSAQQRRRLLRDILDGQQRTLNIMVDRRAVGLANDFDVDRAQSALAETAALVPRESAQIEQGSQRIAVLLGQTDIPDVALSEKALPGIGDLSFSAAPADILRTRPEIAAAEYAVLQAAAEVGVARADLFPRLTLGGTLTLSGDSIGSTVGGSAGVVGGVLALSIPLFDWGARRAVVTARDAQLAGAAAAYRLAVLEGVADVEIALAALAGERVRIQHLSTASASARQASENSRRLYAEGLIEVSDLLAAKAVARQAQLNLAEACLAEALGVVRLHKALGGAMPGGNATRQPRS